MMPAQEDILTLQSHHQFTNRKNKLDWRNLEDHIRRITALDILIETHTQCSCYPKQKPQIRQCEIPLHHIRPKVFSPVVFPAIPSDKIVISHPMHSFQHEEEWKITNIWTQNNMYKTKLQGTYITYQDERWWQDRQLLSNWRETLKSRLPVQTRSLALQQ